MIWINITVKPVRKLDLLSSIFLNGELLIKTISLLKSLNLYIIFVN